jgi:AraC-like DNA-binding protein
LLTTDYNFSVSKHYKYFLIPLVLFSLYGIGVLLMTPEQHIRLLYKLLPQKATVSGIFLYQKTIYIICRIAFVVQGIAYLYFSNRLIQKNKDKIKDYYANDDEDNFNKIYYLNISLILSIVCGIILSIIGKETFLKHDHALIVPSIIITTLLFIIGWLGSIQKAVVIEAAEDEKMEGYDENTQATENVLPHLIPIRKKLKQLFEKDKIYLNKDLNLWDVARTIGTNRTYISVIINKDYQQSFSSFVNNYRVKHAISLITENPIINNQDLADNSGFGSIISMQRAFQQYAGKPISELKEELKKKN